MHLACQVITAFNIMLKYQYLTKVVLDFKDENRFSFYANECLLLSMNIRGSIGGGGRGTDCPDPTGKSQKYRVLKHYLSRSTV